MHYGGYAYTATEKEEMDRIRKRYQEIAIYNDQITIKKTPAYAHTKFTAIINLDATQEAKALSEWDILIIADGGNLCFGGSCTKKADGVFTGSYNTD
jgi:hypothetical protein